MTKILHALQGDMNSIPIGHEYIFYPEISFELIKASLKSTEPLPQQRPRFINQARFRTASVGTGSSVEKVKEPQAEQVSFITLKAPFHVHPLLGQINHVLCKPGQVSPFLVLPGNIERPIIELSPSISEVLLQNIDNIVEALQYMSIAKQQDMNYYSLPNKTESSGTTDSPEMMYHSSAPNTVNRQAGSNLMSRKVQIHSSGTNSSGSLSVISRDFPECSSSPMPSTPIMLANRNLQDIREGFVMVILGLSY